MIIVVSQKFGAQVALRGAKFEPPRILQLLRLCSRVKLPELKFFAKLTDFSSQRYK
jgi:hypothetical protein